MRVGLADWGFHVHNAVRVKPDDADGASALARYFARAPLSLQKLSLDPSTGEVLYHSEFNPQDDAFR